MTPDDITKLSQLLEIQQDLLEAELGAHWWPRRGLGPMPPNDPVLYRLYEVSTRAFSLRPSDDLSWASMPGRARLRPCHQGKLSTVIPRANSDEPIPAPFAAQAVVHEKVRRRPPSGPSVNFSHGGPVMHSSATASSP